LLRHILGEHYPTFGQSRPARAGGPASARVDSRLRRLDTRDGAGHFSADQGVVLCQIRIFARQGLVQALDSRLAKSQLKELFYPAQWETATWNGKSFGVPARAHHPDPFLYWNQAHFEEAGFPADKPPTTLEETRRYADRLIKIDAAGQITRLGFDPFIESASNLLNYWSWAYNVTWYDAKSSRINLVQPGLVAAVEYIASIYRTIGPDRMADYRKRFGSYNSPNAAMPSGVESMKVSSGVSAGTLANNAPQVRVGIGWAPAEQARRFISVGGGHFNCLSTNAPHADAAWKFIEWLTSPRANQMMLDEIGWIAYNKELLKGLDLKRMPNLRFVLDAPAQAQQVLAPVVLPINTDVVGAGVQRVIRGEQAAREMLADVTRALQADLDDALRQG
jgi:ABC-type glycerol-3-phosphate transport system substrate-binding protein